MGIAFKFKKTVESLRNSFRLNGSSDDSNLLNTKNRHTITDRANLYQEKKSFSDFIPLS